MVRAEHIIVVTRMPEPLYAPTQIWTRHGAAKKRRETHGYLARGGARSCPVRPRRADRKNRSARGCRRRHFCTHFATKEQLLKELYLALKSEAYALINAKFPGKGS